LEKGKVAARTRWFQKSKIHSGSKRKKKNMDYRKVLEELVRGHEFATQLRVVINGKYESATTTPFVQSLAKNVLRSFTNTLFLLDKYPSKSEDSQESCKSFTTFKNRRGCYKRK